MRRNSHRFGASLYPHYRGRRVILLGSLTLMGLPFRPNDERPA